ncbi:hypothetical protein ACWDLG_12220 [Nonomuraea sp. NPDC003727]
MGRAFALVTVAVTAVACSTPVDTARERPPRPTPARSVTSSVTYLDLRWDALSARAMGMSEKDVKSRMSGSLADVAVITPRDVWAVGASTPSDTRRWHEETRAVVLHWNGSGWRPVKPPAGMRSPDLIAASSSDNVWVIERYRPGVHRWDGHTWTDLGAPRITDPAVPKGFSLGLGSAVVTGPREAWVAGKAYVDDEGPAYPYLARRTASGWSQVPTPGGMTISRLEALSPDDVWAVGEKDGTLAIAHWDGRRWRPTPTPVAPTRGADVAIRAVSRDEVWATVASIARVMRWDGTRWTVLPPPPTGSACMITGGGRGKLWMVATEHTRVQPRISTVSAVLLRYDGRSWSVEDLPASYAKCRGALARDPDTGRLFWAADFTAK